MRSCSLRRCWLSLSNSAHTIRRTPWAAQVSAKAFTPAGGRRSLSPIRRSKAVRRSRNGVKGKPDGPEAWIALLDRSLPQHLRVTNEPLSQSDKHTDDIAEVILSAQRLSESGNGVDLLYHLGVKQERWRAVVWIVKCMVETIAFPRSESGRLPVPLGFWSSQHSLHDITDGRIGSQHRLLPRRIASSSQSLDELTDSNQPNGVRKDAPLEHDILGSIWRSLGLMSIASADGEMKPEVLEIIAYLHHVEVMPSSIYNQSSTTDVTAIQQPPMLQLFSSTILSSLSDAAWRAHEKTVVEDARAKSGQQFTSQSDIPGAAIRMISPGLRSEIWIELILWSCLHGGWILEGAAILRAIYTESKRPRWRPVPWHSVFRTSGGAEDWDKLSYLFNVRNTSRREQTQHAASSVRRTISSEVVNAYVDALLYTIRSGVGGRGAAPSTVLEYLSTLQNFLERAGLGLQNGSWDTIVLRFFDAQQSVIDQGNNFEKLISLSPGLGEGLNTAEQDTIPHYVLDGNAAALGLFHRALMSRIARGDIQGALRLFKCLQDLADQNKHRSLVDFFQKSKLFTGPESQVGSEMFTSNFPGIEYPGFSVQIPPTVLGPFLQLITDAKAYDWGKWLLYNNDEFGGPVLPECHYNHPAVAPAMVRFAAETRDASLLGKALRARATIEGAEGPTLPGSIVQSFVESQINLGNWRAAERALQHRTGQQAHSLNTITIAHLIRSMLLLVPGHEAGTASSANLVEAKRLLSDVVQGKYDGNQVAPREAQDRVTLLLILLSTLNEEWAEYCHGLRSLDGVFTFTATSKEFNLILEGAVHAYGSAAGRRLLNACWHLDGCQTRGIGQQAFQFRSEQRGMQRFYPNILHGAQRKRWVVPVPGKPDVKVVIYGALRPNVMTMRIILRKAIEECNRSERESEGLPLASEYPDGIVPSETVTWVKSALSSLQQSDAAEDAKDKAQTGMSELHPDEMLLYRPLDHLHETSGTARQRG